MNAVKNIARKRFYQQQYNNAEVAEHLTENRKYQTRKFSAITQLPAKDYSKALTFNESRRQQIKANILKQVKGLKKTKKTDFILTLNI